MAEDVVLRPPRQVEAGAMRQKVETCLRQFGPSFASQTGYEDIVHGMQVANVGSRVLALRLRKVGGAPVTGLLLFGDLLAEQLAHDIL